MSTWPDSLPPFLWGAATSSHQIEGDAQNDWTRWEDAGHVARLERSGRSTGHFANPDPDLDLFSSLGWNAYRLSIEWSRIEPKPGQFSGQAMAEYRHIIEKMRENGLEPLVTLHHFTLPQWFADQGGFFGPRSASHFLSYTAYVVDHLKDLVTLWVTVNEPIIYAVMGYSYGTWPPGETHLAKAWRLTNRLVRLHQKAYRLIKRIDPKAMVGLAHHVVYFAPYQPQSPADRVLCRIIDYLFNWRFIHKVDAYQDFLGINYYTRQWISASRGLAPIAAKPGAKVTEMGWEIYPQGLHHVLSRLKSYRKPILITENGIATNIDEERQQYLITHLAAIAAVQQEGVEVRGYFHWAALDNFEWAEGFKPRFGLVEVNYDTLERTPRKSADLYRTIIELNKENSGREPIIVPSTFQ